MSCLDCGAVADFDVVLDAPIAVFVESCKSAFCGVCGSKNMGLGGELAPTTGEFDPKWSLEQRVRWWTEHGDIGISAATIYLAFTGRVIGPLISEDRADIPHDPDDFQRCYRLLDRIPEWEFDLKKVVDKFPFWGPFVANWQEFKNLYVEEKPTGRCKKLWDRMKDLKPEVDALR